MRLTLCTLEENKEKIIYIYIKNLKMEGGVT